MSEQKMRDALITAREVLLLEGYAEDNLAIVRIDEALAQQPAAVVELTDESVVIPADTWAALVKLTNVSNELDHHAEEYDFDDGFGRGAAQCFWDDFSIALIGASDAIAKQGGAA